MKRNQPRTHIISQLLELSSNELDEKLLILNQKAFDHLERYKQRRKESGNFRNYHPYKHLRMTNLWRDAKEIHIVLNVKENGMLFCEVCSCEIDDYGIMHHLEYLDEACFSSVKIIHELCHGRIHGKK